MTELIKCYGCGALVKDIPGKPSRQSIQSVNTHLISLYLIFEKGLEGTEATQAIGKVLEYASEFVWLEPPIPNGQMTVLDVVKARDFSEHQKLVDKWARDVWNAWSAYHHIVRRFVSKCNIA